MFPNTNNSSATTTLEEPFFNSSWLFLDAADNMVHLLPINNSNAPAGDERQEVHHVANGSITNAPATKTTTTTTNIISKEGVKRKHGTTKVPSKRRGKKDRHSKITTAQGLRDRRMRLSLKVARKFFDLQDMLGFDKASKTIDWLLINSKDAIHQLYTQAPVFNINRHIISDQESQVDSEATEMEISPTGEESNKPCREKRKRSKYSCNVAITINPVARASRDKARARARERTKEKLMIRSNTHYSKLHLHEAAALHHEDSSQEIITTSSPLGETQASVSVMNELLGITRSSSSTFSPDFANHNNDFPGLWSSMEGARIEPAAGCYSIAISSNGVQWNPRSDFSTAPCTQDQQNHSPNSILVSNSLQDQILLTTPAVFTATNSNVCFQPSFPPNQFM